MQDIGFGFGKVTFDNFSIPGSVIAKLPINGFVPTEKTLPVWQLLQNAISEILNSVARADVLLVDLRGNRGGDPATVAFMLSYLLDWGPLHLLDFVDRAGSIKQSMSTLAADQLPAGAERFGGIKPLYVLTSNMTISGGEDMAYNLQAFKRASAIVGNGNEATAGAANPATNIRVICEEEFGKGWWHVGVPELQPVHAVTGSNWEGVGVKSDVVAGKGEWDGITDAEEVAKRLARRRFKASHV
jgi:C-terminal processing protease CtpA/Prc